MKIPLGVIRDRKKRQMRRESEHLSMYSDSTMPLKGKLEVKLLIQITSN